MIASRSSGDGGFPGLAVFSLLGLLLVLGAAALVSVRPWEAETLAPHLSVSPGTGVALGGAVAVAHDPPARVAGMAVSPARRATLAAEPAKAPPRAGARLAVAQLQPVAVSAPSPAPPASMPVSVSPPESEAPVEATPAPVPIAGPERGGKVPAGGGSAGVDPGEDCEERVEGEIEIEIEPRDDLSEILDLLEEPLSGGGCEEEEGVEPGEEGPPADDRAGASEGAPGPEEAPEAVLP